MQTGKLRDLVRIERPEIVRDALGAPHTEWKTVATLYAWIRSVSGREYLSGPQEVGENKTPITVRKPFHVTIDPTMRVVEVYGDRVFSITAVMPDRLNGHYLLMGRTGVDNG